MEKLLTATGGQQSRAFALLQQTVEPARGFENVVRPLAARRKSLSEYEDPNKDRVKIESAIRELQEKFDSILTQLIILNDDELTEVVGMPKRGVSRIPVT